jgi:hypothetical protein
MLVQGGSAYQRAGLRVTSRAYRLHATTAAAAAMTGGGRSNSPAGSRPTSPQLCAMNWRNPTVFLSQASVSGGPTVLLPTAPGLSACHCGRQPLDACAPRLPRPTSCRCPRLHADGQDENGTHRHAAPARTRRRLSCSRRGRGARGGAGGRLADPQPSPACRLGACGEQQMLSPTPPL